MTNRSSRLESIELLNRQLHVTQRLLLLTAHARGAARPSPALALNDVTETPLLIGRHVARLVFKRARSAVVRIDGELLSSALPGLAWSIGRRADH